MTRLAIGELAGLTHLAVRTLRRYHDGGLLAPADVDASSGYRYDDLDQVAAGADDPACRRRALAHRIRAAGPQPSRATASVTGSSTTTTGC